jgi:putative oxidoreductase
MAELKLLYDSEPRSRLADWTIRAGVALVYILFGTDKFGSGAGYWLRLFRDIGLGDWFRYFTGGVEVLGALLVLVPRTALIGFLLLMATMAGAVAILCWLGRPGDAAFPGLFLIVLAALTWARWRAGRNG